MAIIFNPYLLNYKNTSNRSKKLEFLKLILEFLPDEELIQTLEQEAYRGRKTYPIRALWNSIIAKSFLGLKSDRELIDQLEINPELMHICGFNTIDGGRSVPPPWVYSRFKKKLKKKSKMIKKMFKKLAQRLSEELGISVIVLDSTALRSGKKDPDGAWGVKKVEEYSKKNGKVVVREKRWYGFKVFLIVEAMTGLPIFVKVTKANKSEAKGFTEILEEFKEELEEVYEGVKAVIVDKGGDSGEMLDDLVNDRKKGIVAKREDWKDRSDSTRVLRDNLVYDEKGRVYCANPGVEKDYDTDGRWMEMVYRGFDMQNKRINFACPSGEYGLECPYKGACKYSGKRVWIKVTKENVRMFPGTYRWSYEFKELYKQRTVVERVFSQLKWDFGWMRGYYVRGKANVELEIMIGLMVILQNALIKIESEKGVKIDERLRRLRLRC